MRRSVLRSAVAVVAAGGLVAVGTSSALASPSAAPQVVNVVGDGSSVHLSKNTVRAGTIRFNVASSVPGESGSSEITMFKPKGGATAADVLADLKDEFTGYPSIAAKGTRALVRDATFLGLADPIKEAPFTVTEPLTAGKYYVLDAGLQPPTSVSDLSTLTVTSSSASAAQPAVASQFTVKLTSADTFVAPRNWSHRGTVTVSNVSDTLHFMDLEPVKPGTTDREVQAYFDSGAQSQPPWSLDGPYGGSDVQSPGVSLQLTYDLPAGTYVLLCFVADDQTGMPHALMGMHKIVVLH